MTSNLFAAVDIASSPSEHVETLFENSGTRIEWIVSHGHSTDWYDQEDSEWVAVLAGQAVLEFDDGTFRQLNAGDFVMLPSHLRHRVASTSPLEPTIWLAVLMR